MTIITRSQKKALEAVKAGKVVHAILKRTTECRGITKVQVFALLRGSHVQAGIFNEFYPMSAIAAFQIKERPVV